MLFVCIIDVVVLFDMCVDFVIDMLLMVCEFLVVIVGVLCNVLVGFGCVCFGFDVFMLFYCDDMLLLFGLIGCFWCLVFDVCIIVDVDVFVWYDDLCDVKLVFWFEVVGFVLGVYILCIEIFVYCLSVCMCCLFVLYWFVIWLGSGWIWCCILVVVEFVLV